MIAQKLIKYPLIAAGILMLVILYFDLKKRGKVPWDKRFMASSCRAALVMLDKRMPATWQTRCVGEDLDNLNVTIKVDLDHEDPKKLRAGLYRELANNLTFIARNTMEEPLSRTRQINVLLDHKKYLIEAIATGKEINKLRSMTNPEHIQQLLQTSVKVKEVTK